MIKKAILPVAGLGTRFLPASKSIPKEMVTVVDRPAIEYVVKEAVAAGIEQIVLVTHSSKASIENVKIELPDKLRSILGKSSDKSMPFNTLVQFTRRIKDKRVRKSFVRILRELKAREEIIREKLQFQIGRLSEEIWIDKRT